MCGLIGIAVAYEASPRAELSIIESALESLAFDPADERAIDRLDAVTAELEPAVGLACAWPGFFALWTSPKLRASAACLASRLEEHARAIDARLVDGMTTPRDVADRLGQARDRARDVSWRLEHDALQNVAKVSKILREAGSTKLLFELWRLNLIHNQLERLEVRGRDSSGIGTNVYLPGDSFAQFEAAANRMGLGVELARRRTREDFRDGSILVAETRDGIALSFSHKVASEVGELGANVRRLRSRARSDALYRLALGVEEGRAQVIAHTRWASNGVVSEANCHPLSNEVDRGIASSGIDGDRAQRALPRVVLGALNGDIDNYPELAAVHAALTGRPIPRTITTDAKLIPVEVDRRQELGSFERAFSEAVGAFEGSFAIASIATSAPGTYALALRGSGQAIYAGLVPGGGVIFASELYGLVELASESFKLSGEPGEVLFLDETKDGVLLRGRSGEAIALSSRAARRAPISTRDIDRRGYEHYFAKEIAESPDSVRKTLCGKFTIDSNDSVRFHLGEDVIPRALRDAFADEQIRSIFVIGQGTACVAAGAIADLLESLLEPRGILVRGVPATELSGFRADAQGPHTLVIAVSQSGTTADTNRTVDLARRAGAHVLAIVNRRGSDLTDKSHGVFYTSDGRDIEMSVASTKAFYSQVTAGYVLGLALAEAAGALDLSKGRADGTTRELEAVRLLRELSDLPRRMEELLTTGKERIRAAAQLALPRRHWAVVGSGALHRAAEEVRIKLSELCYKSVALDTIEDKKHVDLSSEPFVLVCAAGLSGASAADAVKEVAILRAHRAAPVVICDRGDARFAEYAMGTVEVPKASSRVALLLNALAGHLLSYESACAIDALATPLRSLAELTRAALEERRGGETGEPAAFPIEATRARYRRALDPLAREALEACTRGRWNCAVDPDLAVRVSNALRLALGQLSLEAPFAPSPTEASRARPTFDGLLEHALEKLSEASSVLRRPIDAIKHQAKTVTVGISRDETVGRRANGVLARALGLSGVTPGSLASADLAALAALGPAIANVRGATIYEVTGVDSLGAPTAQARIQVIRKNGVAATMPSRADHGCELSGTKRKIVSSPRVHVYRSEHEKNPLVLCPVYERGLVRGLGLLHVELVPELGTRERAQALKATGRYEDLRCAVTEIDVEWDDALLDSVPVDDLLTAPVELLATALASFEEQRAHTPAEPERRHGRRNGNGSTRSSERTERGIS